MLAGDWMPADPHQIDYDKLPRVPGEHVVVNSVKAQKGVNQHNYLAHHDGRYFVMWSDGPGIEDRVGQRVKFATSTEGLKWSEPKHLTPVPPNSGPDSPLYNTRSDKGFRYIARGFWQRDGELLALATLDEAAGFFGKSLALHAFRWKSADEVWEDAGVIANNAINNFPPKQIPSGEWMMSRRPYDYKTAGVDFLVGGVKSMTDWQSFPVLGTSSELKAEEPLWWTLPDNRLAALFRDNQGSKFLYRSISTDNGRQWTTPVRTDFPDATSKLHGLRLKDGRYVLVSNSNPRARDPLTIAISEDGLVFTRLAYLIGGRHVDYPHTLEHDGHLLVAFAGGKQSVEVLKIKLSDLDRIIMPASVALNNPLPPISKPAPEVSDWIDLGNEGEKLYLAAELTVPKRGQTTALKLATSSRLERAVVGVDAAGRLFAKIQPGETKGPELKEGESLSVLVRITGHQKKPDEIFVQTGPAGSIPAEPKEGAWTLSNAAGNTQANLAVATTTSDAFKKVRVASSHAALADAKPVKTTAAKAPPAHDLSPPHPVTRPTSALMLAGEGIPADTHRIDFKNLPRIPSQHAVISDVMAQNGNRVNQHNYLVHHDGRYWAMWSDGPGGSNGYGKVPHHDLADQHVSFATSDDGLKWSTIGDICGAPDAGYGWIARGFWVREGKLLALASRFKAPGYAGDGLSLHAFEVVPGDKPAWKHLGMLADNSMNNFPPKKLPSGDWLMTRRDQNQAVHFMRGGVTGFDQWTSVPVVSYKKEGLAAEEPYWWSLPDGHLAALFRDNNKSGFLYRAFSTDEGRTWTKPVQTNFPDATSKFSGVRLQDGRYVLVSNSNPKARDPLTLALSNDGLVFHSLGYLVGGRHIDYPHVIEHDGFVLVAFATAKQTVEVLKVKLSDVDSAQMPEKPLLGPPLPAPTPKPQKP
jgi:hypothetical protein